MFQNLESRVLLAITVKFTFHEGVLTIDSTRPRNFIRLGISENGSKIIFDNGIGDRKAFATGAIQRIIINGGRSHDTIDASFGTPVPLTIIARGGADYIAGGNGADIIDAGPGDDTIVSDTLGADVIRGGAGIDRITFQNRWADLRISLDGKANDGQDIGNGFEGKNVGRDIEQVVGGHGNDLIVGNEADNYLWGDAGDDTLYGGAGNDTLVGGAGADLLVGDRGHDTFDSADTVRDRINGGRGFDRAHADPIDLLWKTEETF